MNDLVLKVQRFLVSDDGPTAVEYGVMLALIVAVCAVAVKSLGTQVSGTFSSVSSSLS
jgi:pilus assembly protein Flp/PilA